MIATSTQKTYRGSGIALLLASGCTLIYLVLLLSAPNRTASQTLFQSGVFGLTYIFALCALPGIHAKQARRGEWLGTIGIMMLAAGWILTILMSCIIVVKLSSNQLFSPKAMSSFSALFNANFLFLIIGDTILGISVILAGVFPRWTGIALIVVGSLDLINKQYPQVMAVNAVASVLVVAIFSQWGLTLMGIRRTLQVDLAGYIPPSGFTRQRTQKKYRGSGIALLLANVCAFVYMLFLLSISTRTESQTLLLSGIFGLESIFVLCALRDIHTGSGRQETERETDASSLHVSSDSYDQPEGSHYLQTNQARSGEWLGTIGLLLFALGWILNILISCISVVNTLSSHFYLSPPKATFSILILYYVLLVNFYVITIGDILLGISIIRTQVFPRWTGIMLIVAGGLNLISRLYPPVSVVVSVLVIVIFSQWGLMLIEQSSDYSQ